MIRKPTLFVIAVCLMLTAWLSVVRVDDRSADVLALPRKPELDTGWSRTTGPRVGPVDPAAVADRTKDGVASDVGDTNSQANSAGSPTSLIIRLEAVQPHGTLRLAVFLQPEGFPQQESATHRFTVEAEKVTGELVLDDLPTGTMAVAVFQDLNRDGVLNKGAYGVPTEPYGFSNNARGTFGPPTFASASFRFPAQQRELNITLR